MFARAHIGSLRPRAVSNPIVALDHDAADTAPAKLNGGGKADRTCTDNDNVSFSVINSDHGVRGL
jgi:hypothetical protein